MKILNSSHLPPWLKQLYHHLWRCLAFGSCFLRMRSPGTSRQRSPSVLRWAAIRGRAHWKVTCALASRLWCSWLCPCPGSLRPLLSGLSGHPLWGSLSAREASWLFFRCLAPRCCQCCPPCLDSSLLLSSARFETSYLAFRIDFQAGKHWCGRLDSKRQRRNHFSSH